MSYELKNGSLYQYSAGVYCGVIMKQNVMKKLAKLQAEHLREVKKILTDGADNGDVFPHMWTLHHPNGVQTMVHFIDKGADVYENINYAITHQQPVHLNKVFIASSMDEAKQMADELHQETGK